MATVVLISAAIASAIVDAAPKGGNGGNGGGNDIVSETLGWPAGAVMSSAAAISQNGLYAAGKSYWNATFDYPNNWYATRWSRASVGSPWVEEDLRPLLPASSWSWALHVNDAGTVTVGSEEPRTNPSRYQALVIYGGVSYDLGYDVAIYALDQDNRVAGVRYDPSYIVPEKALYWAQPGSPVEELPPLAAGYGASARWFVGDDLFGIAETGTGSWLAKWTGGSGSWTVTAVTPLPDGFGVRDMNPSGLLAGGGYQAAIWAAPYAGDPTYLPTLAGPYSWANAALDAGAVAGVSEASNGIDILPVLWPDSVTVKLLPTACRINSGSANGASGKRVAGYANTTCKGKTRSEAVIWTLP